MNKLSKQQQESPEQLSLSCLLTIIPQIIPVFIPSHDIPARHLAGNICLPWCLVHQWQLTWSK
jgi:hypothetical protein